MEPNPYDLEGRAARGGAERRRPAHVWTDEEKKERLAGYLEVPPEHWESVRYGTHLRYCTKREGYRPGGFVVKNPFDTKPRGEAAEKRFMKLQNGFNEKANGYAQWLVAYEDLDQVFIKADAGTLLAMANLERVAVSVNENVRKLAEHQKRTAARLEEQLAELERRVAALERARR